MSSNQWTIVAIAALIAAIEIGASGGSFSFAARANTVLKDMFSGPSVNGS